MGRPQIGNEGVHSGTRAEILASPASENQLFTAPLLYFFSSPGWGHFMTHLSRNTFYFLIYMLWLLCLIITVLQEKISF